MSRAIKAFQLTIDRADKQINLYERLSNVRFKKKPKTIPENVLSDIIRTALVLGISAMDAYFTDKFIEKFVPYIQKHGTNKTMVSQLEKLGFSTETALELIPKTRIERPYRRLRNLVEQYLERLVTQRFDSIDKLFNSFTIKDLSKKAEKKARRKNLLKIVENAVKRRHAIVHKGDLNKHDKLRPIKLSEIKTRLRDIATYVEHCDDIINSKTS